MLLGVVLIAGMVAVEASLIFLFGLGYQAADRIRRRGSLGRRLSILRSRHRSDVRFLRGSFRRGGLLLSSWIQLWSWFQSRRSGRRKKTSGLVGALAGTHYQAEGGKHDGADIEVHNSHICL